MIRRMEWSRDGKRRKAWRRSNRIINSDSGFIMHCVFLSLWAGASIGFVD